MTTTDVLLKNVSWVGVPVEVNTLPEIPEEMLAKPLPNPHITLKWGLLNEHITQGIVTSLLRGLFNSEVMSNHGFTYAVFEQPEWENVHFVYRINTGWSERFHEAHNLLSRLPHIDTFPKYRPHLTIATVPKKFKSEVRKIIKNHKVTYMRVGAPVLNLPD